MTLIAVFKLEEIRTFRWGGSIAKPLILDNLLYTLRKKYADPLQISIRSLLRQYN